MKTSMCLPILPALLEAPKTQMKIYSSFFTLLMEEEGVGRLRTSV